MGFWNEIKKSISDSIEFGRLSNEMHQRWKREEAEYKKYSPQELITMDNIIKGINIVKLSMDKKEIELQIKYGKNNKKAKRDLQKAKNELSNEIDRIKKDNTNIEENIDEFVGPEINEINYRKARERRVALCFNYLNHPKSTEDGRKNAILVLLYSSPYVRNMQMDIPNLKKRFSLYEKMWCKETTLNVLEISFYFYIISNCDVVVIDLEDKWWENNFSLQMVCGNSMKYNDEMYGTHFRDISFYGLSDQYTPDIKKAESEFWELIYQEYNKEKAQT